MFFLLNFFNINLNLELIRLILIIFSLIIISLYRVNIFTIFTITIFLSSIFISLFPDFAYKNISLEIFAYLLIYNFKKFEKRQKTNISKRNIFLIFSSIFSLVLGYLLVRVKDFSDYTAFSFLASGGEDAAQALDTVHKLLKLDSGSAGLATSLYTPGMTSLYDLVLSFLPNHQFHYAALVLLTVTFFASTIFILSTLWSCIKKSGDPFIITLIGLIHIITLTSFFYAGHYHYLLAISIMSFTLVNFSSANSGTNILRLLSVSFFWWPAIILGLSFVIFIVVKDYKDKKFFGLSKIIAYLISPSLLVISTLLSLYVWFNRELREADWQFDIFRDAGGVINFSNELLILILILILIQSYILRNSISIFFNYLNLLFTSLLTLLGLKLFYLIYIAASETYSFQKFQMFVLVVIFLNSIIFFGMKLKIEDLQVLKLILICIILILFSNQDVSTSFIKTFSFESANNQSNIGKQLYTLILENKSKNYYCLIKDNNSLNVGESYKCSRWMASIQGEDDRSLDNQMGWRFWILDRTDGKKYQTIGTQNRSIIVINNALVSEVKLEDVIKFLP